MINVEAPARICFFGDHQDYLGLPVIAGTINRFIQIKASPINDAKYFIELIDLEQTKVIDLNQNFNSIASEDYFRSCMSVLSDEGAVFKQGYKIEISGNIPVNAGVSSSSALVVAWLRFLLQAQEVQWEVTGTQIGVWAYKAEVLFFNQPGGLMDQYTIAQGGLIYIDTQKGITTPLTPHLGTLILAESGIAKQTLAVLKNAKTYALNAVAEVQKQYPDFLIHQADEQTHRSYSTLVSDLYKPYWYASIYNHLITQKAKLELLDPSPTISKMGAYMNQHQKILEDCIQNTPEAMKNQMNAARDAGAFGAKIIGSGGGGCMVALADEHSKERVIQAFLSAGAQKAYEVKLTI